MMAYSFSTIEILITREWRRLFLEPSRLLGMLIQPLIFLLLFGLGFHKNFAWGELSYISFFFPGILGLVILFSSIYSSLTLVEDKSCGFFRLALVSPGGAYGAIIGKMLATASLGLAQSYLFLLLAFFLPIKTNFSAWLVIISLILPLGALCFSAMGVLLAWLSPSSSAFHAIMSVFLLPMWLLSGAMFPIDDNFLYYLSFINPMAYLVKAMRACLFYDTGNILQQIIALILSFALVLLTLMGSIKRCKFL